MTTSDGPCTFKRGQNWNCGSYAFNLRRDGIDQGTLCDTHYWQTECQKLRSVIDNLETQATRDVAGSGWVCVPTVEWDSNIAMIIT